jgi:hypothetical protein
VAANYHELWPINIEQCEEALESRGLHETSLATRVKGVRLVDSWATRT